MIPRTSIDEANRHLNLLHGRVSELEKTVAEQHDALIAKDQDLQMKVAELSSAKDAEIEGLRRKLHETERTVYLLQQQVHNKDQEIEIVQSNFGSVKTLLNHKTSIQHLLQAMKEAERSIRDVDSTLESPTPGPVIPNKSSPANGFNGVLSSPESHSDQKTDSQSHSRPGSGDKKVHGRNKKRAEQDAILNL